LLLAADPSEIAHNSNKKIADLDHDQTGGNGLKIKILNQKRKMQRK
jgi:hypothetical protein